MASCCFSDAGDVVMSMVGADQAYIAGRLSYFSPSANENRLSQPQDPFWAMLIHVRTQVPRGPRPRKNCAAVSRDDSAPLMANCWRTCNQLLLHVSLETRRLCEPEGAVLAKIHCRLRRSAVKTAQASQHAG